ncbi:ATP-binding protein [Bacteriovoracales bacterium]|nr:ATP-binding protein [Bacteriovoracales bacterium]
MVNFKVYKKFIPAITTCFVWIIGYYCCYFCASFFNTPTPPLYFFVIPTVIQIIFVLLISKKNFKISPSFLVIFHLVYGAFFTQGGIDGVWNTIAYSWGILFGGGLALCLSNIKTYMIGHFSYYTIGALTFYLNGNKIGFDETSNLPHLVGAFMFFPAFNIFLCHLKDILKEKNEVAKNLSNNLQKKVKEKTYALEMEKESYRRLLDSVFMQKKSRDELLNNLGQGYLTFNENGKIQEGFSKITKILFECTHLDLEDKKIWDVLFKEPIKKTIFKKWVNNIWLGKLLFKDLKNLGPKVFYGSSGQYIELEFQPIYLGDSKSRVDKVILIASDKTAQRILEAQLEKDREESDLIKLCMERPMEFIDLMNESNETLEMYKNIQKLNFSKDKIYRVFHTLKAQYGHFRQKTLVSLISDIEDSIESEDFNKMDERILKLDNCLKEIFKKNRNLVESCNKILINEGAAINVKDLSKKIEGLSSKEDFKSYIRKNYLLKDIKCQFSRYEDLINDLSIKYSKSISFKLEGSEILIEIGKYFGFVNSVIHIFRNMVDHGIEDEGERVEKGKPLQGLIKVSFIDEGEFFKIEFSDDGKGIDYKKITEKCIEKELLKKQDIDNLSYSEIINLIFLPGFSTKSEITNISGRGIGMDVVKSEVEKLKGSISVKTKINYGTELVIRLPKFV